MMVVIDAHNHIDNNPERETYQTADVLVKRLDKCGLDMSVITPNPVYTRTKISHWRLY